MKHEIEEAIGLCIDALNNHIPGGQKVEGNDQRVLEIIHKSAELPYAGRGLGVGDRGYRGFRNTSQDYYKRMDSELSCSLYWLDAILYLYDFANYDEDEILKSAGKIVNDDIIFNHILKHIITNLVIEDDIQKAEEFIKHFRKTTIFKESDNFDQGYLIILHHFALKGDKDNFFKYFRQSKPAQNRSEVNEAKETLVSCFAYLNGIEDTIRLCEHKNLGKKYFFSALSTFAEQGKYQELKKIFKNYPELKQPEAEVELKVLASAYLEAKNSNQTVDDDFEMLFDRAVKVDRKLRWGDFKLQDAILFDLGLASSDNVERVKRCRKAIKNNLLKKELVMSISS